MTGEELLVYFNNITGSMRDLLQKKNADYAVNYNALRNIERVGHILELYTSDMMKMGGPQRYLITLLFLKLDRLCNIMPWKSGVNCESFEDTLQDMCNYLILLGAYIKSKEIGNG